MKLIFLYGPPASGKYSIAKELVKETGYKLFHNHLTVDLATEFFQFGTQNFWDLVHKIRLDIFEIAVRENIEGMIFTYVYEKDSSDDAFIKKAKKIVEKNGGEVVFIHVTCSQEELLKRVENKSRFQFQKIKTRQGLSELLDRADFTSPIPFVKNIELDTTNLAVEKSVEKIMQYVQR